MKKKGGCLLLSIIFLFCCHIQNSRAFFGKSYVVKVNQESFTKKDILTWWRFWKEKKMTFPDTSGSLVDWVLLSQEAKALGLEDEPSYKRKLQIFLEVRGLLQLKYDEVDSKIKINPDTLWEEYVRDYTPRLKIKALMTEDPEEAKKWKSEIHAAKDFQHLFEGLKPEKKAKDFGWERPLTIPKEMKKTLLAAKVGDIAGPVQYRKRFYVFRIEERKGPKKEDYQSIHRKIAVNYKKKETARLTGNLITRLKKKYAVSVDWEAVGKIGLDKLPEDLSKKKILGIGDRTMTGAQFQAFLKKDVKLRVKKNSIPAPAELTMLKRGIVNNTISQTLTTWEALNRHYERDKLKDIYTFYQRQRLVRELENKIIWPQIKVTEEDIKNYYKKHLEDFTKPSRVEIAVIRTKDEKLIQKTYRRIHQGEDFFEVARDVLFHGVKLERHALKNLVPEMVTALKGMKPGDISPIIHFKGWYAIVKFFRRYPETAHPLKLVKTSIKKDLLHERFTEARKAYLKKLKERSKIEIDSEAWKSIRKSQEKSHASKKN